jgi:predicted unusual protein kinase regulating ubiquinone biosynthesis (AarF/ABC1/UbiB family)
MGSNNTPAALNIRGRSQRALWFGARVFLNLIFWELILSRIFGQTRVAQGRLGRMIGFARQFRALALDLGGVWIKLGQFLSSRVDILPPSVIAELTDLQDAVPAEPTDQVIRTIERELGQPISQLFTEFEPNPIAAASFGQAHRALLNINTPSVTLPIAKNIRVVVKIQRPNLDQIVATDLRSLKTIMGWAKWYRLVRERANVDDLVREFSDGILAELDYEQEARNAELFAHHFAHDAQVRIPKPYKSLTTRRVLVLENVEAIKITDYDGLAKANISRVAVGRKLFDTYLQQFFTDGFFHADPHPGNLFVQPLELAQAEQLEIELPADGACPFRLTFIDFGMVGTVPKAYEKELREIIIATSLKDARRVTAAAQRMGMFLPGADLFRIEQAVSMLFDKFWGLNTTDLVNVSFDEMFSFAAEFRDLLSTLPFQMPQNMLYLGRAANILSGMSTALDPQFNPWKEIQPFAQDMAQKSSKRGVQDVLDEVLKVLRQTVQLPNQADQVLSRALSGHLEIRAQLSQASTNDLRRIENSVSRLGWLIVFAIFMGCGTALLVSQFDGLGGVFLGIGGLALIKGLFG